MKSGVYELVFGDTVRYVGKSINIEKRWLEHTDNFRKGKAAAKMQQAYNHYGLPDFTILTRCHPDHIDIMESFYIRDRNPVLNTTRPECITEAEFDLITSADNIHLLKRSTVDHIEVIAEYRNKIEADEIRLEELSEEVDRLSEIRDQEEIEADAYKRASSTITILTDRVNLRDIENKHLKDRIAYLELPWWKKLFS